MTSSPKSRCEPASSLIKALGGITAVAKVAGVSAVTVQRWRFPVERGGTGGFIPRKHHQRLIEAAQGQGVDLPSAAFVDESYVPRVECSASTEAA